MSETKYEPTVDEVEKCRKILHCLGDTAGATATDIAKWHLRTLHEVTEEYASKRNQLISFIPQTYGEAIVAYPWLTCQNHEWDNCTTEENVIYLIDQLRAQVAQLEADCAVKDEALKEWQIRTNHIFNCHECQGQSQCEWAMEQGRKLHKLKEQALSTNPGKPLMERVGSMHDFIDRVYRNSLISNDANQVSRQWLIDESLKAISETK